ncbi:MAG: hypothetical protein M3Q58_03325 [Bacteroidota bacterium]|nr:hypothetical protein [Bacteroidota bacterium]
MKKTLQILSLAFFVLAHLTVNAGENKLNLKKEKKSISLLDNTNSPLFVKPAGSSKEITDGGFFFNLGIFMPGKNYMFPPDIDNDTKMKFNMGFDMDLGNMFKISDVGPASIGLKATFFSGGITMMVEDTSQMGTLRVVNGSLPRVGPYVSIGISDVMAFDMYYQIGPSYVLMMDRDWNAFGDGSLGATHEMGFNYRISVLSLGVGYRFGKVMDMSVFGEDVPKEDKQYYQSRTNNLRIFIGIKV